jgi:organic hydroperoxide reductase OsmC/OhrA
MADAGEVQHYSVFAAWSGDGKGCGTIKLPQADLTIPIGGARALGGCGLGTNPEELLMAAVAACFVDTWAIFLKKLGIGYAEPSVAVFGTLGKDPAGGFKMLSTSISAKVPAALYAEKKTAIEKTLALAEKYCIISKVARAAMPVTVTIEEV